MESLDLAKTRSSFYCWVLLAIFIAGTTAFMISFYNKTVAEINKNNLYHNYQLQINDNVEE